MDSRVEKFEILSRKRWEYLSKGNAKAGNKCFDELRTIFAELEQEGKLNDLAVLLEHSEDSVRYESASKLLPHCTNQSMNVLHELSKKMGTLAFTAEQTLKWWNGLQGN